VIGPYGFGGYGYGGYGYGGYGGGYADAYYVDDYADDYDEVYPAEYTADYASADTVVPTNEQAAPFQQLAEQAFRSQQYDEAARQSNHVIIEDGENGKAHLFAAQALFAVNDYDAAAAAIFQGMSLLDQKEWGFIVENYRQLYTNDDYVVQMDRLIEAIKKYPDVASLRFVRGYHYTFLGHKEAAKRELLKAHELDDRNPLVPKLLGILGAPIPASTISNPAATVPNQAGAGAAASEVQSTAKVVVDQGAADKEVQERTKETPAAGAVDRREPPSEAPQTSEHQKP
jgi:tetratricopeptide (TPR) repeat protein